MRTFSPLIRPVASATPDGDFKVARRHRWIPKNQLALIESLEEEHRETFAEARREQERRRIEAQPYHGSGKHPEVIGFRRAVILLEGDFYGSERKDAVSRSHSRAKAARRDRRSLRQLPLAA